MADILNKNVLQYLIGKIKAKVDAKYTKPKNGIPKTDLASAVQTSLGKADSALQTETDPVFSSSAASGITSSNITTWNGKYAKPNGGIPKSDLVSAVQTSLGKADTALQSVSIADMTDWASTSDETISNILYHVYWNKTPTADNDVYGLGIRDSNGILYYIRSNKGILSATAYNANTNTQVRLYKDETSTYPIIGSRTAASSVTSGTTAVYGEISQTNAITMTPSSGTITATNFSGKINNHTVNADVPSDAKFTDTTYENKSSASGGTDISLVTTGEKYDWSYNKLDNKNPYILTRDRKIGSELRFERYSDNLGATSKIIDVVFDHGESSETTILEFGYSNPKFNGHTLNSDVPSDAKFTDTVLTETDILNMGFTKNTGTYTKPSGGIPKTDLASAVQTSLGKADTALQAHQDISGKVNKSGDTMTNTLNINASKSNHLAFHRKDMVKGNKPTANMFETINFFEDGTGEAQSNRFGDIEVRQDTDNAVRIYANVYQNIAGSTTPKYLGMQYNANGTSFTWTDTDSFRTNKLMLHDGANYVEPMSVYDEGSTAGSELAITANGNTFIGGGESARGLRTAFQTASNIKTGEAYVKAGERTYITSDGEVYMYSGANTVANRKGVMLDNNGVFRPAIQGQDINLGSSGYPYNIAFSKHINACNNDGKTDIFLSRDTQPTETVNGEARVRIGYPSYTNADNKTIKPTKGKLDIRSSGGGFVNLTAKDTLTSSTGVNIELPDTAGTLALDTTATTSANGLMSSNDKTKLDTAITGTLDSNYYGMTTPDGSTTNWIRTTSSGLIPNQAGSAGGGHASIGTSTWRFKNVYTDNLNGTDVDTLIKEVDKTVYKYSTTTIARYVSPSGNDSTGDGTSSKPWKTIQYAIDNLPYDVAVSTNLTPTIYLASGTYTEANNITVTGKRLTLSLQGDVNIICSNSGKGAIEVWHNAVLFIQGNSSTAANFRQLSIQGGSYILRSAYASVLYLQYLKNLNLSGFTGATAVYAAGRSSIHFILPNSPIAFDFTTCADSVTSIVGINVDNFSGVYVQTGTNAISCTYKAVVTTRKCLRANTNGNISINNTTVTNEWTLGLESIYAGNIGINGITNNAITKYNVGNGGTLNSGYYDYRGSYAYERQRRSATYAFAEQTSDKYNASTTYSKDALCFYLNDGYLYKSLTDSNKGNTPSSTSTYWTRTTIADELQSIKDNGAEMIETHYSKDIDVCSLSNKWIMINGLLNTAISTNGWTIGIIVLDTIYRPSTTKYGVCVGATTNNSYQFRIQTNGYLDVYKPNTTSEKIIFSSCIHL